MKILKHLDRDLYGESYDKMETAQESQGILCSMLMSYKSPISGTIYRVPQ